MRKKMLEHNRKIVKLGNKCDIRGFFLNIEKRQHPFKRHNKRVDNWLNMARFDSWRFIINSGIKFDKIQINAGFKKTPYMHIGLVNKFFYFKEGSMAWNAVHDFIDSNVGMSKATVVYIIEKTHTCRINSVTSPFGHTFTSFMVADANNASLINALLLM